jgi:F0F1-type ATP synthase assembly protein I
MLAFSFINPYTASRKATILRLLILLNMGRKQGKIFLGIQAVVTLVFSGLWWVFAGVGSLSALVGGLICLTGNGLFVLLAFRHAGAAQSRQIYSGFFLGQLAKFFVTVTLFGVAFWTRNVMGLPLILGFMMTQGVFWVAPLVFKRSIQAKQA